jgi:hypothetical protein
LEELWAAALEACQGVEEGKVQDGSSMASRLCTLSRHVAQHTRRALHLGVQKALGVVATHYQVDLEAVSTSYVIPVGVNNEVAMNRADALAPSAVDVLAEDFMASSSQTLPGGWPSSLKIVGRVVPFMFLC